MRLGRDAAWLLSPAARQATVRSGNREATLTRRLAARVEVASGSLVQCGGRQVPSAHTDVNAKS